MGKTAVALRALKNAQLCCEGQAWGVAALLAAAWSVSCMEKGHRSEDMAPLTYAQLVSHISVPIQRHV